jgi:hypothetical protein
LIGRFNSPDERTINHASPPGPNRVDMAPS